MPLNKSCYFLLVFFALVSASFAINGCASMQHPQGGPRDRTPPRLLKSDPPDMTRNFKAKKIVMEFDEYFKLTNPYSEIVISPAMEKPAEFKTDGKKLVVDFKDSLLKNTTYVINFGKALVDVNEGNLLKNFTYVFSTGNHIDSLSVSGSVTNTESQKKEKDILVMLFPSAQDSVYFGKKKPAIFTTTDSSGNFSLNNLHDGDYRIYALKEASPDKIYNNDQELIGYLNKPIRLYKDTSGINLRLFKQSPERFRIMERRFEPDGRLTFIFNKPLQDPSIKITYPPIVDNDKYVEFSPTKDTAHVWLRNMDFDSLRVAFFNKGQPLDTVYQKKGRKESFTRDIILRYNLDNNSLLRPGDDLQVTATQPIAGFEQNLFELTEDSVAVSFNLQKDAKNLRLLNLKYRFKQNAVYQLTINEGAITDIYTDKSKKTIRKFQVNKTENYGTLTIKLNVPDTAKTYQIQVLNATGSVLRSVNTNKNTSVVLKDFLTGKYRIKVIYDANKNGFWDSGSVKRGTQPENIWLYDKEISLRANWETEEIVDIPREVTAP